MSSTRMNHCAAMLNSTGTPERSETETFCSTRFEPRPWPASSMAMRIRLRASWRLSPAKSPARSSMRPFGPTTSRVSRLSRFHFLTSSPSPNVQTIMRPVPKSGSTSGSVRIGTS